MILGWILNYYWNIWMFPGFPGGSDCKESACNAGDLGLIPGSLGKKDPLEKGMATHSSLLACRIPWTEEPCGLWSVGSQRVGHNWVTNIWLFPGFPSGSADKESACSVETWVWSLHWEDPLENSIATHSTILAWRILMDRGDWWAAVHRSQRFGHDWATKHTHVDVF